MFFADAICQQYFIPILRKFQHFLSQIQSFMFSFMQSNQIFIVGKHSTMVKNSIVNTWCRMLEGISTSPRLRITLKFRNKLLAKSAISYFPNGWWRAGQKFLSSIWINLHHCGIKGLLDRRENAQRFKIEILAFHKFFLLEHWIYVPMWLRIGQGILDSQPCSSDSHLIGFVPDRSQYI